MTIANRDELAQLAAGVGAELGVASGSYSETLLRMGRLDKLYSVDRWTDHHDEAEMAAATEKLEPFGSRSGIIRSTFEAAADLFGEGFFDFIYIDGYAHTGQDDGKTLAKWWPKLKRGGIFAGHDYDPQYEPTVEAVDRFAREHGLSITLTGELSLASWMIIKP